MYLWKAVGCERSERTRQFRLSFEWLGLCCSFFGTPRAQRVACQNRGNLNLDTPLGFVVLKCDFLYFSCSGFDPWRSQNDLVFGNFGQNLQNIVLIQRAEVEKKEKLMSQDWITKSSICNNKSNQKSVIYELYIFQYYWNMYEIFFIHIPANTGICIYVFQ